MAAKEIQINTSKTGGSYDGHYIDVNEEKHWDNLSKAFKRYTHTIQYPPESGGYDHSKYNITVVGPSGSSEDGSSNKFKYKHPELRVEEVEVYFKANADPSRGDTNPLVVGFITTSYKYYYTWNHLTKRAKVKTGTIGASESISDKDLIHGLLEELGRTSMPSRKNKLVIRLCEIPTRYFGPLSKYPGSGHFKNPKNKITVRKETDTLVPGYVGYEHTFRDTDTGTVSECYVSYENNSRYIKVGNVLGLGSQYAKISSVTAYYEDGTGGHGRRGSGTATAGGDSKNPVLIVFNLTNGQLYGYSYGQFVSDLKGIKGASDWASNPKTITDGDVITGGARILQSRLQEESRKLRQLIEFRKGGFSTSRIDDSDHKHITTSELQEVEDQRGVDQGDKFMKVTMTANTKDVPDGPWRVYNINLFTYEPSTIIQGVDKKLDHFFTDTSSSRKKYSSITVYYSPEGRISDGGDSSDNSDSSSIKYKYMALLVEFDDYDVKTYIRRENEQGTKWAQVDDNNIGSNITIISGRFTTGHGTNVRFDMPTKLRNERERLRPLITFLNGNPDDGRAKNEHIITNTQDVGQGVVGQESYRFQKVTMTSNTSDIKGAGGSSVGPWRVYSDHLFTDDKGHKIDDSAKMQGGVLVSIYTSTSSIVIGNDKKYWSIAVYYAVTVSGSTGDKKALLVKFEKVTNRDSTSGTGGTKYIKRTDASGSKWAKAYGTKWASTSSKGIGIGIGVGDTNQLVQELTEVAIDAGIITGATVIIGGGRAYVSKVDEEKHWDPLSKAFKRYTHTIQYPPESGGYDPSQYSISVYYKGTGSRSTFTYKAPNSKVVEVEVYFKGDASPSSGNAAPLVVGFVYASTDSSRTGCSGRKCYYTWVHLKGSGNNVKTGVIDVESFGENDLITRLLELIGDSIKRPNKLVIRLGERPGDSSSSKYPGSGHFKDGDKQVTVTKKPVTGLSGFEKFEHSVGSSVSVGDFDGFYVSYGRDSMYIVVGSWSWSSLWRWLGSWSWSGYNLLDKVTVYFNTGTRKLVLIVFHFKGTDVAYVYTYSDFISDLKKVKTAEAVSMVGTVSIAKIITGTGRLQVIRRDGGDDSHMLRVLKEQWEKLRPLITFVKGEDGRNDPGRDGNKHITTSPASNLDGGYGSVGPDYKFKRVTMKPNADDKPGGGGSPDGPWIVYSTKLITRGLDTKIEPESVLDRIYSGDTNSPSRKYKGISVYYTPGLMALLVEFDPGDGDKQYIKRVKQDANRITWAKVKALDVGTNGEVTVDELTRIAREAGIIQSNTKTAQEIRIETSRTKGSYTSGGAGITVNVTEEKPWDRLSKLFKKYVHTIEYRGDGCYEASKYNITLYSTGPGGQGGLFGSGFTLNTPDPQVKEVEVYFSANDNSNSKPLVVGFVYDISTSGSSECDSRTSDRTGCATSDDSSSRCTSGKCYYTWSELTITRSGQYDCVITVDGAISENDLLTVLLEELGRTSVSHRKNKLVIRLSERPASEGGGDHRYPATGFYKDKITVTKARDTGDIPGFDKYEHTFTGVTVNGVDGFYVSYKRDSRYIKVDSRVVASLGSSTEQTNLEKVAVYYKVAGTNTGGTHKPLLFVFHFKGTGGGGTYDYPYSEFYKELQRVTGGSNWANEVKTITELSYRGGDRSDSELLSTLQEEIERLKAFIEFKQGGPSNPDTTPGTSKHENVNITELQPVTRDKGHTFKRVTITPNIDDKAGGFPVGPWRVYNDDLISYEPGVKIQGGDVLAGITTSDVTSNTSNKYSSITVYYAMTNESGSGDSEYWALLVKFVKANSRVDGRISSGGGETMLYYKRENQKGDKWVDASKTITGGAHGDSDLLPVLQQQWEKFRPLITFVKGSRGRGTTGRENITTTGPTEVKGQDSARLGLDGQDSVGQGYRFIKYTMTPDTKGESKGGPWEVYSEHLLERGLVLERGSVFNFGHNPKIDESVLESTGIFTGTTSSSEVITSISKRYSSITVYYGTKVTDNGDYSNNDYVDNYSDYKALLLEFVPGSGTIGDGTSTSTGCGRKTYIKRVNKGVGGSTWEKVDGIGIGTDDTGALTQIARAAFATVARGLVGGGVNGHGSPTAAEGSSTQGAECVPGNTDNPGSQDGNLAATVGGSIAGVGGVGGITGIVIYKNLEAVSGLIGRIAGK